MTLAEISALILVGGLGTRLRTVVSDRAKPLAEVQGRPFICFLLDQLADAGLKRAVLCTGYLGERVQKALGMNHGPLALEYSQEPVPLGTAGAFRHALSKINSHTVLAMNGDSYLGMDLQAFATWHAQHHDQASLALVEAEDTTCFGQVELDADNRIRSFREKSNSTGAGWINGGIYLIPRTMLHEMPDRCPLSIERDVFPTWTGRLWGYKVAGPFIDIGTPESYAQAAAFFLLNNRSSMKEPRRRT